MEGVRSGYNPKLKVRLALEPVRQEKAIAQWPGELGIHKMLKTNFSGKRRGMAAGPWRIKIMS